MGFRFRKSIKLGKGVRINFSKSGVGWSVGGKGFRLTKKARGGYRTTSSIHGTGISYSKDFGGKSGKKNNNNYHSLSYESTQSVSHSSDVEPKYLYKPLQTYAITTILLSLWIFYFIPAILGIYIFYCFCKELKEFVDCNLSKSSEEFIMMKKPIMNAIIIQFLLCFWWLIFPLVIGIKKIRIFLSEFKNLKSIEDAEFLELQKILITNSGNKLIYSKKQLHNMAHDRIENDFRIIDESQKIIEETMNIDTFFMRSNLIVEKYKDVCLFEAYMPFGGGTPSEAYAEALSNREEDTKHFIYQYIAHMLESAESLKTERGKFSRYQKSYDAFRKHYDTISHENQVRIETEFRKLLII